MVSSLEYKSSRSTEMDTDNRLLNRHADIQACKNHRRPPTMHPILNMYSPVILPRRVSTLMIRARARTILLLLQPLHPLIELILLFILIYTKSVSNPSRTELTAATQKKKNSRFSCSHNAIPAAPSATPATPPAMIFPIPLDFFFSSGGG